MADTAGYQVGNAWIQMLPSFDKFHKRIAKELAGVGDIKVDLEPVMSSREVHQEVTKAVAGTTATVDIKPEVDSKAVKAVTKEVAAIKPPPMTVTPKVDAKAAARELSRLGEAKSVEITPDFSRLDAKLRELEARRTVTLLTIDADLAKARERLAELQAFGERGTISVDVDADIAKFKAQIKALEKERASTPVDVKLDIVKVNAEIERLRKGLTAKRIQLDLNIDRARQRIKKLREEAAEDVDLDVTADITNAELQIEHFQAQKHSVAIEVSAKIEAARARLRELEKGTYRTDVQVDVDLKAARAMLADLEAERRLVNVDVDAEIAAAEAKIQQLTSRRDLVEIQADLDAARALGELRKLEGGLHRISNNQHDINMEASDASRAVAIVGLLTAGLSAVGYAAPAAAAALAAIPAALAGVAQGFGAIMAGLSGVSDATKALQAVDDQAVTRTRQNADARAASTKRIAAAQSQLERALEQADRSAIQSARQVQNAREGLADAQVSATRRVQDAERSLATAQQSSRDAQEALTRARKEATEDLEDLRLALSGAALDEEAAVLAVEQAQERLNRAREAGLSGRPMAEIELEARQANQRLAEVRERYGDLKEEAAEASRSGVDGNRRVVAAQRDAEDSANRVLDAERNLADARTESAREVAKAQERVAEAQQQAAWAAADASRQVADAQAAIAEASTVAGSEGSAALDKLAVSMDKLTPAGQQFALFLQGRMKPALQGIGAAAQGEMLPRLQLAFQSLLSLQGLAQEAFAETGRVIGDLAIEGAEMVTSGPWRADFATIMSRNNRVLGMMGDAGLSALDVIRNLTVASGPLVEALAASTAQYLDQFAAWIQGKRDSGELAVWFAEMEIRIRDLVDTASEFASGVWNLLQALAPLGRVILNVLGPMVEWVGAMAEAHPALTTMIALAVLGTSSFISFFRTVGGLTQAFRTSTGVYQNFRDRILGTKKATDDATAAAVRNATATQTMGTAAERTGGLVGKLRTGLDNARTSYDATSTAITSRMIPATSAATRELDTFLPATQRAATGFGAMALSAQTAMTTVTTHARTAVGNVAGAVGGTVAAVGRGVGGIASGLVGALGGPFGLAITAATIGLGFLVTAQVDAAQAAAEHKAQIQSLTDALVESGGALTDNVRDQIRLNLEQRSATDYARNLGLSVGGMIRAIGEGGTAAQSFERDLDALADELTINKGLVADDAVFLRGMATQIMETGGSARDFSGDLNALATEWQRQTGKSDEARDAYKTQLTQYLDLVSGYRGAKGDFDTAEQNQKDQAEAHEESARSIERQLQALKALQDQVVGSINKDLAYRQSLENLKEATDRVTEAHNSGEGLTAALLGEEQALLDVITKAGDKAFAESTATDEVYKHRDAMLASAQQAFTLANTYGSDLPASLATYISSLILAKDSTGQYINLIGEVPFEVITNVIFKDKEARQGVHDFLVFVGNQVHLAVGNMFNGWFGIGERPAAPRALGGIDIPAYAHGGIRPMSGRYAQIVPPNQPRLIGDRMRDAEAFIPLNTEPRSVGILGAAAQQMGFGLVPLAAGGILGMQAGGINQAGTPAAAAGGDAALTVNADAVDAFTEAVQQLVRVALAPLADEVNSRTAQALTTLEDHAGVKAVAAVTALADQLPPLRTSFAVTATAIGAAWLASTQASQGGVNVISGYLATLRQGLGQTGTAFSYTAEGIGTSWARIRQYAADPVRAVLSGPYNAGLIPAWNHLNAFFALNRPLAPVAIPFAVGGEVPGVGNKDSVPALLTPGEYVISKPVVKKWGLRNIDAAHMAARRGGFPGLEGMLTGDGDGIFRVGFASGGPVPEALARATAFGRTMDRKPYIWGGSSEAGTDCSGWMAMLARALLDVKPYARREWATAISAGGNPPPRFTRGIDGVFAIGVNPGSHTAGTLAGTNVEAGGAHNYVAFGPPSVGADDRQFPLKFHLPELGGKFVSGGGGGGFDLAAFIGESFNATYEQLARFQEAWGANMLAQAGVALTRQAADAIVSQSVNTITPVGTAGDVESWRPLVLQALRMLGLPMEWADITLRRMNQESGGNPRAVNNWDINAQRGDPSKGLMQVIGSTFRAHRDTRAPDDVFDPLANILASMKYAMSRYGSLPAAYGRPGGYDVGGYLPPGYSTVYNGTSRPEAVLTGSQWAAMYTLAADNRSGGELRGNLYLSTGEFLGVVQGVINNANDESGRVLARRTR